VLFPRSAATHGGVCVITATPRLQSHSVCKSLVSFSWGRRGDALIVSFVPREGRQRLESSRAPWEPSQRPGARGACGRLPSALLEARGAVLLIRELHLRLYLSVLFCLCSHLLLFHTILVSSLLSRGLQNASSLVLCQAVLSSDREARFTGCTWNAFLLKAGDSVASQCSTLTCRVGFNFFLKTLKIFCFLNPRIFHVDFTILY